MSKQEKNQQQKDKEYFEAQVKEFKSNLSGDLQKNAIDFAEHMCKTSGWVYLDESVCFTVTDKKGNFYIFVNGPQSSVCNSDFDKYPISDELKAFTYAHISHCGHIKSGGKECGCSEKRWRSFTVLGKKYDNLCYCCICFHNPDAEKFEKIKEWVEAWKLCIDAVKM